MHPAWDFDDYFDSVLAFAEPGTARLRRPGPAEQWQSWWCAQAADGSAASRLARSQGFVLTAAQSAACGVTREKARWSIDRGRWSRPGRGLISPVDVRDPDEHLHRRRRHALVAAGAALTHREHAISGRSGAIVHGLPTFAIPERPELTDGQPAGLGRRAAAHRFGATIGADDVMTWFGTPVLTIARTLADLGRHDRWDAIMAADAALHERLVTVGEIDAALEQARGWPGVRQAREVLALADGRAESPLESLTRLRLIDDGFPRPELQVWFGRHRVDLVIEEWRLIIEADGLGKYSDDEIRREKRREQRLRPYDYRVERVIWDDVVHDWPRTRARLWSAGQWRFGRTSPLLWG